MLSKYSSLQVLLKYTDIDPLLTAGNGETAAHVAAARGHTQVLKVRTLNYQLLRTDIFCNLKAYKVNLNPIQSIVPKGVPFMKIYCLLIHLVDTAFCS